MKRTLFVLYVADQARSRNFYAKALARDPELDVPGMTEFALEDGAALGLMPEQGISALLERLPDPASAHGIPRCELYLVVEDPARAHARALDAGGRELSPLAPRDWGHSVSYCADPDGHVLAFALADDS